MSSEKKIAFIDLKAQQEFISSDLFKRIHTVLAHGQYVMGPEVTELEGKLSAYVGVKNTVTCSSGTDALLMSLMAYGVCPGDAIFTTPFTFIATAEVIQLLGATPVFVDIEPQSFNMDPKALQKSIATIRRNPGMGHLRPKGVIPVDIFGQPADYDAINAIAKQHGMFVLEDAAQSFGAVYKGRRACSLADVAATSFFPAKPLGCYGDGGAIFTDDDGLAEILRSIRVHGKGGHKYENVRIGINGRMDTLQAAIVLAKLEVFDQEVIARQKIASRYSEALSTVVQVPHVHPECTSVWAQYSVLSDKKSELQKRLQNKGIPTAVYYPLPLHMQKAFSHLDYKPEDFPVTMKTCERIFSLPMHPYLNVQEQNMIIEAFQSA